MNFKMSKNEKKARSFNFEELLGKTIKTAQDRDSRTKTGRSRTEKMKDLGSTRTRTNTNVKISDEFGPIPPRIWRSINPWHRIDRRKLFRKEKMKNVKPKRKNLKIKIKV